MTIPAECNVNECDRRIKARGYCTRHYDRLMKYGDVNKSFHGTQSQRFWAKVNKTDTCWLWTASKTSNGYGQFNPGGRSRPRPAHRVSWELVNGPIPHGSVMDHICFTPLCVNPQHLRPVTQQLNAEYKRRGGMPIPVSGLRGVYWAGTRWVARVRHRGVDHNLGRYDDKEEAGRAAAAKRAELFKFPEFQGAIK